jgi:lysophospholipase L1-like esterase
VSTRVVVALGDSITRGRGGEPALGVHPQSWAQWLTEAMGQPLLNLAGDGAVAADVLRLQVPRLEGPYALGLLYVGANDVRGLTWDLAAYERDVRAIVAALRECCARVVVLTLPEDLGRPASAPKPGAANRVLRALDGVELVELADFGGSLFVLPDTVHPTSAGMVEIARRAARVLGAPVPGPDDPVPAPGLRYRAWWGRLWLRDLVRRTRERRTLQR